MTASDVEDDRSRSGSPDESGNEHPTGNGNMSEQTKDSKTKQNGASNAKDPSRPRRKKARRACFACQRAHLTCGMLETLRLLFHELTRFRRRTSMSKVYQARFARCLSRWC